jgi:hypothetical protein
MWQFITRHCANGAGMQKGFDYAESYAPVATACSIRIIIALAAGHNMTIGIADVKNAFQNTMLPISQCAHVSLPPYYLQWFRHKYPNIKIAPLASESDKYCLQSINAIQGTKPAGQQWNKILTNVLQFHKYKQNPIDHAVFVYHSPDKTQTQLICVSTDDFLCAFTYQSLFDDLCTSLKKYFKLTTKEGPTLNYLNLGIRQTPEYISIDQNAHIKAHSTNAELHTMFTALKQIIAFRYFLEHLGYGNAAPTRHHEDNQPSKDVISANKVTSRFRHVHIPICYMHHHYDRGTFAPKFCKCTLMCANICTKPCAGPLHHRHYNWVQGLCFCIPCTKPTHST